MLSGTRVLDQITEQVTAAEREVARTGAHLRELQDQQGAQRAEEARALARLAAVRLGELAADRIRSGLDAADEQALELLRQRQQMRQQLQQDIGQSTARLLQLADRRRQALLARDSAAAAHQQCAKAALQRLGEDEVYQLQRGHVEQLTQQAGQAETKAQQAEADRERKREPYERDRLFSYLWRRRYGFPEYRAWPLFRTLDGWVARLCRYDTAHRDYGMLLAIPVRLRQHAAAVAATAKAATEQLAAMEQAALAAAGAPALAEAAQQRDRELEAAGAAIDAAETAHDELLQRQAESDRGGDEQSQRAARAIEQQLQREDVATLRRDALATPTAADDELVQFIGTLRQQQQQLEAAITEAAVPHQRAQQALAEMQDLRRRFRQENFDADQSVFAPGLDLGTLLGGILSGALRSGTGWSQLRRHQRYRSLPTANSGASIAANILGGLLSASTRSSSHRSGGGFGGGGFRSGGGFGGGGGGFRTGGGF